MPDELANAGTAPAAAATPPISGANDAGATPPAAEPRNAMQEAFLKAHETVEEGDKPRRGRPPKAATLDREMPGADRAQNAAVKDAGGEDPAAAAADALKAPERWEQGWKEAFAKQPREIQEAWLAQHGAWEKGFNKKFEELADTRKFADAVNAAIPANIRKEMQDRGVPADQAIGRLFQRWHLSEQNPAAFIAEFMQAKRIDPRIFLGQGGGNGQQPIPGSFEMLAPLLQPLVAKISRLEQGHQAWQAEQEARHEKVIETAISSFYGETDEQGLPKRPYMDRVVDTMVEIIENDPRFARMPHAERLEKAYEIAVLSDPTIRAEIISAEASKRAEALEQERLNGRLGRSASARPAASSSAPAAQPKGLRGAFERP
jgi:hypothetical protein